MSLTPFSYQYVSQLGLTRLIDASSGPDGPNGVRAFWLVPTGEWHNGQRLQHDVVSDLGDQNFDKTVVEGVEYYLVPEESSNTPGRISHYAQLTGQAELANPPQGGVNRVRETFEGNTDSHTVAPGTVEKYVKDNDSFEEARKTKSEEEARVDRQVSVSPAREPAEGKLVIAERDESSDSRKTRGGTKADSEKEVKSTGDTKA